MSKFIDGIFKQNPLFVLFLGLCVALGTSANFIGGTVMAVATAVVLLATTIIVAIVSKALSKEARIIASVIVAASLTSIIKMMLDAYAPSVVADYALFFPMIAVSSVITTISSREDSIGGSIASALGSAIGFIIAMALVALVRELLATGGLSLYNPFGGENVTVVSVIPAQFAIPFFAEPFGAFLTIGTLSAVVAAIQNRSASKKDGKAVA